MTTPANQISVSTSQAQGARTDAPIFNFFGRRFVMLLANAFIGEVKSRANKIANWSTAESIVSDQPHLMTIGNLGLFAGRDESGHLRGGDMPWQYMQGVCDGVIIDREKREKLARTLAQLPSNMSFTFKADPKLRDQDIVRAAFARAGFVNEGRTTLLYTGEPGSDALDRMKSDARTKIRKGRKELEFTKMSVGEFFEHYRQNLGERKSHFFLNIDEQILEKAVKANPPQAEIIALRRKDDTSNDPRAIEAAAIVSMGADGYCKLLRLTFRRFTDNDGLPAPHQQALKVVVVEAMNRAANRGLPLDVDGFTPGGGTVYERFGIIDHSQPERGGIFEKVEQDQFSRTTAGVAVGSLTKRARELVSAKIGPRFFA